MSRGSARARQRRCAARWGKNDSDARPKTAGDPVERAWREPSKRRRLNSGTRALSPTGVGNRARSALCSTDASVLDPLLGLPLRTPPLSVRTSSVPLRANPGKRLETRTSAGCSARPKYARSAVRQRRVGRTHPTRPRERCLERGFDSSV